MRQKTNNIVENDENKSLKIYASAMKEVRHFDSCAIKIAPSVLENRLKKIWNPVNSFTRLATSFTFAIALLAVLVTADFKYVGFPGDTWRAFFLMAAVIAILFFAVDLALLVWNWRRGNLVTVEQFVGELTREEDN